MRDIVAKGDNIPLGRQGENLCTRVTLPNIRSGAGTVALYHQRSGDAAPYPLEITEDGDSIYWDVSSVDTAALGFGRAEMQWLGERGEILKSRIYHTYVEKALTVPMPPPDPLEDYAAKIAKSAAAAKVSEDAAARYSDTAYKAAVTATEQAEQASGSATYAAAALKALKDGIAAGDFKGDPGADGKDAPQIDDTAISAANPWSSKHIVDMLCSPLEESGNPVVCYPVPGYPLGVVVSWEPTQEGTGDPSPENVRPISGRRAVTVKRSEENLQGETLNLTLPETIYGGEVDAVSGDGQGKWVVAVFDGSEAWMVSGKLLADKSDWYYVSPKIPGAVNESPQKGNNICSHYPYADVANRNTVNGCAIVWRAIRVRWGDTIPDNADSWKAYLAAQYAAGTPVQVAYKLATPVPFSATGAQPIHALPGVNTILTDADTVTVTGRADPIKRITDLEDALASVTTND